jgi:hypothetical protein
MAGVVATKHLRRAEAHPDGAHHGSVRSARSRFILPKAEYDHGRASGLQLLNNKFVIGQSTLFAERLRNEVGKDQVEQIRAGVSLVVRASSRSYGAGSFPGFSQEAVSLITMACRMKLQDRGIDPAESARS